MVWESWVELGIIVLIVFIILYGFRQIRPTHRGIIEFFGKYRRYAMPGLRWIIPFVERLIYVPIVEEMVDAERQEIITKDNLNAGVDAQVYFKVRDNEKDVKASQYGPRNYRRQIVSLARTTLRNIIGTMTLKQANSERNKINDELMRTLAKETANWGIEVVRTELKEIQPPEDVQETMNKVVKAENEKVAAIDYATAVETKADGERRAYIKNAQGKRQSEILIAEGKAQAIKLVNEAAKKYFVGNAKEMRQIEMVEKSLKNNAKIVVTDKGINPNLFIGRVI